MTRSIVSMLRPAPTRITSKAVTITELKRKFRLPLELKRKVSSSKEKADVTLPELPNLAYIPEPPSPASTPPISRASTLTSIFERTSYSDRSPSSPPSASDLAQALNLSAFDPPNQPPNPLLRRLTQKILHLFQQTSNRISTFHRSLTHHFQRLVDHLALSDPETYRFVFQTILNYTFLGPLAILVYLVTFLPGVKGFYDKKVEKQGRKTAEEKRREEEKFAAEWEEREKMRRRYDCQKEYLYCL